MAKLLPGYILSGKVGDLVYCKGPSGKQYVRRRPKIMKEPSEAQLASRLRLKLAANFLSAFRDVIKETWKQKKYKRTPQPFNQATSHTLRCAITGTYPDLKINYEEVCLSYGTLVRPDEPSVLRDENQLLITWETDWRVWDTDSELVVALFHEEMQASLIFRERARRGDGNVLLDLPEGFKNGTIHAYMLFLGHDGKNASRTVYIGPITRP